MADIDQAAAEAALGQVATEVEGEAAPFYEYGDGDDKLSFKNPEELHAHMGKSINFERDYTRKSQDRENSWKQRNSEFDKRVKDWEAGDKAKYDRYKAALDKRPSIGQALQRMVDTPVTPDEGFQRSQGYTDEKYDELEQRLASFEQERDQEKLERERESIYEELGKEYPDIKDVVPGALEKLDGNDLSALMRMIYKSEKYNPAEMQEVAEQNIAKKQGVGMIPVGGGPPAPKSTGSSDPKKATEEAQAWANS